MSVSSLLRFSGRGFAYVALEMDFEFHENTTLAFQVTGNFDRLELAGILREIITIRNTNPFECPGELNYLNKVSKSLQSLDFHYLGNGSLSILVNKCRVLFVGEANLLQDFCEKLENYND